MQTTSKPFLQPNSRRPLVDLQAPPETKKLITSRYAQGHYNPGKERKHSVENDLNEFEGSRGAKRTKTTIAVASAAPASSKNFVGAAKSSLKEKQLLKEKRMRKTGTIVPKSHRSLSSLAPIDIGVKIKAPLASRKDSFYSQSHDSIRIDETAVLDPLEDIENRVRVIPKASAPAKTIHVARASTKFRTSLTISNNGSTAGSAIPTPVVARKVVQPRIDSVKKVAIAVPTPKISTKLPRVASLSQTTASAASLKTRLEKAKSSTTTLLLKEPALATKATNFNGHNVTNVFFPAASAAKKRIFTRQRAKLAIKQDPMLVKEYDLEIYSYWREVEVYRLN
jgi:hypothetical protein